MKRMAAVLLSGIAMTGVLMTPAQADTKVEPRVNKCNGYSESITPKFNAFAGHRIEAQSTVTHPTVLGNCQISKSTTPKITLPSRSPGSLGESVTVTKAPYRTVTAPTDRHTYRFSIKQTVVGKPFSQTFNFDVHYYADGRARICFAGGSCGPFYD